MSNNIGLLIPESDTGEYFVKANLEVYKQAYNTEIEKIKKEAKREVLERLIGRGKQYHQTRGIVLFIEDMQDDLAQLEE